MPADILRAGAHSFNRAHGAWTPRCPHPLKFFVKVGVVQGAVWASYMGVCAALHAANSVLGR